MYLKTFMPCVRNPGLMVGQSVWAFTAGIFSTYVLLQSRLPYRGRPWLIMRPRQITHAYCQKPHARKHSIGVAISAWRNADEKGRVDKASDSPLKAHANTHNAMKQTYFCRCTASQMKWPYGAFFTRQNKCDEQLTGFNRYLAQRRLCCL